MLIDNCRSKGFRVFHSGKTSSYNSTKFPSFFRRQHDRSEEFIKADSGLSEFDDIDEVLQPIRAFSDEKDK